MIPIEQQVCSLELAKRLKELGVKQESLFCYFEGRIFLKNEMQWIDKNNYINAFGKGDAHYKLTSLDDIYSAFTVAELGIHLPSDIMFDKNYDGSFDCCDKNTSFLTNDKNEANSRAKMRIYLIENGLVEVDKL